MGEVKMRLLVFMTIMLVSSLAFARAGAGAENACSKIAEMAVRHQAFIPRHLSGRRVVGNGRFYLNFAPDKRCRMKDVFVVPNDRVEAYSDYQGFTDVTYWDAKGNDVSGWVLSSRVVETGTGIGPKEAGR
jgi:hypothetical protein